MIVIIAIQPDTLHNEDVSLLSYLCYFSHHLLPPTRLIVLINCFYGNQRWLAASH